MQITWNILYKKLSGSKSDAEPHDLLLWLLIIYPVQSVRQWEESINLI